MENKERKCFTDLKLEGILNNTTRSKTERHFKALKQIKLILNKYPMIKERVF